MTRFKCCLFHQKFRTIKYKNGGGILGWTIIICDKCKRSEWSTGIDGMIKKKGNYPFDKYETYKG